jgi:hypothetical protein
MARSRGLGDVYKRQVRGFMAAMWGLLLSVDYCL